MRPPAGVILLSLFFASLSGGIAALLGADLWRHGISRLLASPEQLVAALALVLGVLLLAFVAFGLWDLDEDARWVAFAFFSWPALVSVLQFAAGFNGWDAEAAISLVLIALFTAPCIYLQLRPIRQSFVQLILLDLSR